MKKAVTGLMSDVRMMNHNWYSRHPQSPQRLSAITKMLIQKEINVHPSIQYLQKYQRIATNQEIRLCYTQKYIQYVTKELPQEAQSQESEIAARLAAGGCLEAADRLAKGQWQNAMTLVRPPGHHSGYNNQIQGFCVFNNIALTARYLQQKYNIKKIAILDYDVHHGNGTQEIFKKDKNILFISIHRYDRRTFYPAGKDGHFTSSGQEQGQGFTVNIPLDYIDKSYKKYSFQAPGDNQYIYAYNRIINPILKQFQAQFLLISSGFDASRYDPLGGFTATPNFYYYVTRRLTELNKPILCTLQGGYNLLSTAQAASAVVQALVGQTKLPQPIQGIKYENIGQLCQIPDILYEQFQAVIEHHAKYWKSLIDQEQVQYGKVVKSNKQRRFGVIQDKESSSSSSSQEENG